MSSVIHLHFPFIEINLYLFFPGATSSEFDIIIKSLSDTGIYFCKVSCPSFQMECRSDFAILRIKDNSKQVQKKYAGKFLSIIT